VRWLVSGPCPAERFGDDMTRYKSWTYGFLAAGLALSLAAIGCGDDDTATEAGSGGSGGAAGKAGAGGAAGKAGTGGAAGKAGGGAGAGGTTSPAVCKTDATTATGGMVDKDCLSCACDTDPNVTEACNKQAMCWPLISCVNTMCAGMDPTACAPSKCGTLLAGASQATAAGMILQGTCKAKCIKAGDAGVDAGF
jgi:hypothetical protein